MPSRPGMKIRAAYASNYTPRIQNPTLHGLEQFAKSGTGRYVYALGFLPDDKADRTVREIAEAAYSLAESGVVSLVQKKVDPFTYVYFAERR